MAVKIWIQPVYAVGWRFMSRPWPDLVVAIFALICILLATAGVVYLVWKRWQSRRRKVQSGPLMIRAEVDALLKAARPLGAKRNTSAEPSSFRVYLGHVDEPPTATQLRLLATDCDLFLLDPCQDGVAAATAKHVQAVQTVARLDAELLWPANIIHHLRDDHDILEGVRRLAEAISSRLIRTHTDPDARSAFTGVLLANWHTRIAPEEINELIRYCNGLQFDVYLEASGPEYFSAEQCATLDFAPLRGILCRNATIFAHGDRCNYFQMTGLRRVQRALAKHVSLGGHTLLAWEVLNDDAVLDHAVVKRSYNWCRFNSVPSWIVRQRALTDAGATDDATLSGEPLSALLWLKSNEISELQKRWRENDKISNNLLDTQGLYSQLDSVFPSLSTKLAVVPLPLRQDDSGSILNPCDSLEGVPLPQTDRHPLDFSYRGRSYDGLGCFQIGVDCTAEDFDDLVEGQKRLKDLKLLSEMDDAERSQLLDRVQSLTTTLCARGHDLARWDLLNIALEELQMLLKPDDDLPGPRLRIYTGLHSGFRKGLDRQFWGLYAKGACNGTTDIFLSRDTKDILATLLHTFLSSRGFPRSECFAVEHELAEVNTSVNVRFGLSSQSLHDISLLTPSETIVLLRRLMSWHEQHLNDELVSKMIKFCKHQLLDVPTTSQLRAQNTSSYLRGQLSAQDLMKARFMWYRDLGAECPDYEDALSVFEDIHHQLPRLLLQQRSDAVSQIQESLKAALAGPEIDTAADILALAVFCAFRKLAVDEVYLEVLDRNPLPNRHSDQAACFAEMFGTGSQCSAYLDLTPQILGQILAERYQAYYKLHQPPMRDDKTTEQPTAYASRLVDEDPSFNRVAPPQWYRVSFLGIFAVPALIDILLLTTIGKGLYLSVDMGKTEKGNGEIVRHMATIGLMVGLLTCGAFGTWIGSGGSYYYHAMAFPAMNMFVLTRLLAGGSTCLAIGIVALLTIGPSLGFRAAWVFVFYFMTMASYLTLLATLAIYQTPGFSFQSGRIVVIFCIPILFISPLLTIWVQHDIIVYPCVLFGFLVSLICGTRHVISRWGSWYLRVPLVSEAETLEFFKRTANSDVLVPDGVSDLTATAFPRTALAAAVDKERSRRFWHKPTTDPLVKKLADGFEATMYLMEWYTQYSRTRMPYRYSPTWNLQCKAALDTLKEMQKGLRLHNAFLHWRYGGDEVWCGVLYFAIALMDKWLALLTGGSIVGLGDSSRFRFSVGFGLAYYLVAAICLDVVALPLWAAANKRTDQPISSLASLDTATAGAAAARRRMYWSNLAKFFFMHLWGAGATAVLMWTFEKQPQAIGMYLAYVGAYTGLLWYQYNRIYTGALAMADLLCAALLGLMLGLILRKMQPNFLFGTVLALAFTTWMTGILSLRTARIFGSRRKTRYAASFDNRAPIILTHEHIRNDLSEPDMLQVIRKVSLPSECDQLRLDPSSTPGLEVMHLLTAAASSEKVGLLDSALPFGRSTIGEIACKWRNGSISVDILSTCDSVPLLVKSICTRRRDGVHVQICDHFTATRARRFEAIRRRNQVFAETIVQAAAETLFGIPRGDTALLVLMLSSPGSTDDIPLSESSKCLLEQSAIARDDVLQSDESRLLPDILLGLDCDREWDKLPFHVRSVLLQRCCGLSSNLSPTFLTWMGARFGLQNPLEAGQYTTRRTLVLKASALTVAFARDPCNRVDSTEKGPAFDVDLVHKKLQQKMHRHSTDMWSVLKQAVSISVKVFRLGIKLIVIALVVLPIWLRLPICIFYIGIWLYCHRIQKLFLPWFLLCGRQDVSKLLSEMKGVRTVVGKRAIVIESLEGPSTCFVQIDKEASRTTTLQFSGRHDEQPRDNAHLMAMNTYDNGLVLAERKEFAGGKCERIFVYGYGPNDLQRKKRLPLNRSCVDGDRQGEHIVYDERGYVTSGSYYKDGNLVEFQYFYRRNARYDEELLQGVFKLAHISMAVSWSVPKPGRNDSPDNWLPYPKVTQATFTEGADVYHSVWDYEHRWHPVITTLLNGKAAPTPPMIEYDWFGILSKPRHRSFLAENPLVALKSVSTNWLARTLKLNVVRYPVSTSLARSYLWKTWKSSKDLDAVVVRWLDEKALRAEHVLKPYWRYRDTGRLNAAETYVTDAADAIMARTDLDPEVSAWSTIAFKYGDLATFGQGGNSRINTKSQKSQLRDGERRLHVLATDTGTWPNEGGGVSACRRDMVNDLKTIKWHVIAESANDYGIPKFQVERNVQSLSILPLWGLDFLTPSHGVFEDSLDSAVQQRSYTTNAQDIRDNFLPILDSLVKCARAVVFDRRHILEATKAFVELNAYFTSSRHWSQVWMSDVTKQRWQELWLSEYMDNTVPISQWLDAECPTLKHLDDALDMWQRYLFIFSLPVPEKIPDVFQASHHFAGATYGVLCKVLRGCTLHVWDHCISWREVTVFLSSAMSWDPPFVCTSLMSLSRMTSVLVLHYADVVLPCADFFNPGWEIEHGTQEGLLQHRRRFARKIDPVVNGICNMDSFHPVETIKTKKPTVVMLSHVRFVKDIKTAILAADIVVNEWGIKDYQLDIYGDMEKAPAYSVECKEILASKGLRDYVALKGLGKPSKVLQDGWLFLNSSISEGLPLAMGEAALAGVPIVCTDVGASFRVVTNPVTWKKFSAVVAPNDALSLAKAQIDVLALLDEWAEYANDEPEVTKPRLPKLGPVPPTPDEVRRITERMYAKTQERRALGMIGRRNILNSFSGDRYLREHEQMLWVGKLQNANVSARRLLAPMSGLNITLEKVLLPVQEDDVELGLGDLTIRKVFRGSGWTSSEGYGETSGSSSRGSLALGRITPLEAAKIV